ncbi:MAG: FAD-dependent oxidoreductase [Oribacterium sp.]|nr:FAD-dependent oxidoreductase [Oribacterium sp.]
MDNKTVSRRSFVKGIGAGLAALTFAGIYGCGRSTEVPEATTGETATKAAETLAAETTAAQTELAKEALNAATKSLSYTQGTYSASARGMASDVKVTMTFDEKSITDIKIDVSGETQNIGAAIGDEMSKKVLDAQGAEIDAVSGATVTSDAIKTAVLDCMSQASGQEITLEEVTAEASADWLGEAPEIAESDIKDTVDTEVLVVGAGSSGLFAAAAAAEKGAKTILIEKFEHDKASGIRDTMAACDSTEQKEDGHNVDKNEAIKYICDWSQGYARRSQVKIWANRSGETMDWFRDVLKQGGMEFRHEYDLEDLDKNYKGLEVGHSVQYDDTYYEQQTMDKVLEYAEAKGLETRYEVTMIKLEKNDAGRVTGLIATDKDGNYVRYNASKGVIIATGGYSADEDMLKQLQPWTLEQTSVNYSKAGAKGSGIRACLWAGAVMDTTHTSMIFERGAVKPDETGKQGEPTRGALFWMGSQPFLKVNLNGERFMNESQPYDYILHQATKEPFHTYCEIWDSKYTEDCKRFETHGCSRLFPHANGTAPVFTMEMVQGMNEGLEADGFIVKADTIEELAEKLGLPADKFKATVDRYNELYKKGEDEDFGKEGFRLSSLTEAPFYGVRQAGGYLICTMDGILINEEMHALDSESKPIEGLFVVGNDAGGYYNGSYPNLLSGTQAGRIATFGRLAGQLAAEGK